MPHTGDCRIVRANGNSAGSSLANAMPAPGCAPREKMYATRQRADSKWQYTQNRVENMPKASQLNDKKSLRQNGAIYQSHYLARLFKHICLKKGVNISVLQLHVLLEVASAQNAKNVALTT